MSKRKSATPASPKTLPIEVDASAQSPLGMSPQAFLRDYWQKRPLLIRNAFPGFVSPIEPGDLAGLACEDAALSRLITYDRAHDGWSVRSGPFQEEEFPGMPDHDWTLLVQDVDKWDADVRELLQAFAFLPRWRIDDIMVSFAATGGSVGAHVDQYDVFLLQAHGHRRWQIDASPNPPLGFRDDVELKLLRQFNASHDWVLGPGDMLYLPPGVPHHGVAEDPCLTFSVGMRAPSAAELIGDYLDTLVAEADESLRYQDPDLKLPADPNEIDAEAMTRAVAALNALRMNDPERLANWFGRFITTYRSAGEVAAPAEAAALDEAAVEQALADGGNLLHRHPMARMAWRRRGKREATLFVSGQDHPMPIVEASWLASTEAVSGEDFARLSAAGRRAVTDLVASGHYVIGSAEEDLEDEDEGG
jgi:50S ribosomal protein L16 3-hydroxylase